MSKILSATVCAFILMLLIAGCKKENTELPVLGTCQAVVPTGHLSYNDTTDVYTYRTSGGGSIKIDLSDHIILTHDDYENFKIEFWGSTGPTSAISGNHENLNGKHIKDRLRVRRTIIFPDGAKITMVASDSIEPLLSVSIYDGEECHHINTTCRKLEYSGSNAGIANALDNTQPDGETGTFEFTSTGLLYVNIYQEDVAGNKVMTRVPLGELDRSKPNQVNDYYDDPRFGHT